MAENYPMRPYMSGFGNEFSSEAEGYEGAIPQDGINPQRCKFGLFAEQLSGSAFTAPRGSNKRSWLYRIRPSVCHLPFEPLGHEQSGLNYRDGQVDPNQKRWRPFNSSRVNGLEGVDFIEGLHTLAYSDADGSASSSVAIHIYLVNADMTNKCFMNSDGDFLIVPQGGTLHITTEFGPLLVEPNEIAVIQQGMKFTVSLYDCTVARGYILEVKGNHFELPYLGPIGANGLANPRDFLVPSAKVLDPNKGCKIILKMGNQLFEADQPYSPYDVAAWFGNYTPYKYDLEKFVCVNSVSVDHPDPSIFTVLTCPSIGKPGTALADFVIFPPRWECASNTFRPPYFHRNCMTEFMGLIRGKYQAKSNAFAPGGGSLHQSMMPHGPDVDSFLQAYEQDTSSPRRIAEGSMAFMFETSLTLKLSEWARSENVDNNYYKCWEDLGNLEPA